MAGTRLARRIKPKIRPVQTPYLALSWTFYHRVASVTPSVGAPLGSIDAALTPEAVSLPTEPALNDSLDPPAVSVLPATASGAVGQEAVVHDEANSE